MNDENDKHEFNFFLDKQIQQKLFEADEEQTEREAKFIHIYSHKSKQHINSPAVAGSNSNSSNTNSSSKQQLGANGIQKSSKEQPHSFNISGWVADPNITYRKVENESLSKSKLSQNAQNHVNANRDFISSRGDRRNTSSITQDFVFKHYTDPRRYMEQYRRQHACYDSANSSATKNEFMDTRRFYAYDKNSPLAVSIGPQTSSLQTPSLPPYQSEQSLYQNDIQQLQSAGRREAQKQTNIPNIRTTQQHQYKLEKGHLHKTDSIPSVQSDLQEVFGEKKRAGSAGRERPPPSGRGGSAGRERHAPSVNGVSAPVHKAMATKVNVPASNGYSGTRVTKQMISSSPLEANSFPNQFHGQRLGATSSAAGTRTLDTLACVANGGGDRQTPMSIITTCASAEFLDYSKGLTWYDSLAAADRLPEVAHQRPSPGSTGPLLPRPAARPPPTAPATLDPHPRERPHLEPHHRERPPLGPREANDPRKLKIQLFRRGNGKSKKSKKGKSRTGFPFFRDDSQATLTVSSASVSPRKQWVDLGTDMGRAWSAGLGVYGHGEGREHRSP